jgi:tRNA (guanine37-N1)-methyltransferase
VLVDCVSRLLEGVLADKKCYEDESISCGMLEYPQYTRPYEFHGKKVPDVLISGNHAEIDKWRMAKALEITKEKRPDLIEK